MGRDSYKFERIMYVSGMSFPNPCAFHARSFYEEKFVTSCVPPTIIPECVPPACNLCATSDHNSYSCSQYIGLRA